MSAASTVPPKAARRSLFDLPAPRPPRRRADPPGETRQDLATWFAEHRDELPTDAYRLRPGVEVLDPETFHRSLEVDLAGCSRARAVPLSIDLQELKAVWARLRVQSKRPTKPR